MDMTSLLARVASGLAVRLAVAVAAIYVASHVYAFISHAFTAASHGLPL